MEYKLLCLKLLLLLSLGIDGFDLTPNDVHCFNFDVACSQCIQEPFCQWCSQPKISNKTDHHCFSVSTDLSSECEEVENPHNSPLQLIEDSRLTDIDKGKDDTSDIVQLRPQRIKLQLRKGSPVNFTISYRQVKDYPLDLYYLMDLSKSMYGDKVTLAKLGKQLAKTMKKLTKQFKIGFGSFVDKVMLPFVNIHPVSLKKPCNDIDCATPFSFKNNLKLSEGAQEFVKQVEEAQISSNIDSPEGGFDALMQAMVCEEQIGWRKNVRKIIIFSTDALPHIAGDGKLAGIVTPNDGKCHLSREGYYEAYDKYDYPSIGQIDYTAQERSVHIIFAVKSHLDFYKKLSERIKGASFGELVGNSSNVVDLVKKVYNSIRGKVELEVRSSRARPASLRFFTDCGIPGVEIEETNVCNKVKEGATFNFTVEIMATDCPTKGTRETQIELGTLQDSLLIDLDLLCDCGCEHESHKSYERNSPSCSGNGIKQCEVCQCNPGFYGQRCQCNKNKSTSDIVNDQRKCRPEGSNTNETVCSGRGRCECETCICWKERHLGTFCQCDKVMCRQNSNSKLECSGNGVCDCGSCLCAPGWEGQFCQCRSRHSCLPNAGKELCSGNGECFCGKCECKISYTGKFCEECPSCGEGKCLEFRPCVQWENGELQLEHCKNSTSISLVEKTYDLESEQRQWARLCTFEDEQTGCKFKFTYKYTESGYEIYAENSQECPEKIDPFAVTFGVISGIVVIGVVTLVIWKILTTIHDRREYIRFEKEREKAAWKTMENPIYESATTTVANPAFMNK